MYHLKNSPVKYIINMFPDICSQAQKLAIYSMENCLEEVSFSRIFTVKQVKKLNRKEQQSTILFKGLVKSNKVPACLFFFILRLEFKNVTSYDFFVPVNYQQSMNDFFCYLCEEKESTKHRVLFGFFFGFSLLNFLKSNRFILRM